MADEAEQAWRDRDHANRERAQALVADARLRAAKTTEQTLGAANAEQNARVDACEKDIRAAADRAIGEIEQVAADAAQMIVTRVSGIQVPADEVAQAVRTALHA